jgi:hypothetical protein
MTQRYARISDELVKAEADRVYSVAISNDGRSQAEAVQRMAA